ncbi:MAG: hypothetical protein NTX84_09535, partial [Nitrospirae bacterium]|nr:hypothetical protein [Nitrospirota bacterium]
MTKNHNLGVFATLCLGLVCQGIASEDRQEKAPPIDVRGDEQSRLNLGLPDGGLKPVVGVHNIQIFRSSRSQPELSDQDGWTYAHHQDLAAWKGRLYAAWAMTPKDEDIQPYKLVYATTTDGFHWTAPADLFPRENAWPVRFYFYRAANDRMLTFCAGKTGDGNVKEGMKTVMLVREIGADHQLGKVYTLVAPQPDQPAFYKAAADPGFIAACDEAVGNNLLLEQQDYGRFLGKRRMPWHGDASIKIPGDFQFGKAFCFYHRKDGTLVGLSKMGFATLSEDAGKTWSKPVQSETLIAGPGKIWGQRTADGRFALAYRVVHGEVPALRYPGRYKSTGAQYMRGIAEWADDGTFADKQAMWLIYSMHKEDIWVARVPLPITADETAFPSTDFAKEPLGGVVTGWNVYSPRWAPVAVVDEKAGHCLELRDADPFDYARAVRCFPASPSVRVELSVGAAQTDARLEIEMSDAVGHRPVRVAFVEDGKIQAT